MLAPAMKLLIGVLVRTTITRRRGPITDREDRCRRRTPSRALKNARWTFSLPSTYDEWSGRGPALAEAVDTGSSR
jgi:hypothetical protein